MMVVFVCDGGGGNHLVSDLCTKTRDSFLGASNCIGIFHTIYALVFCIHKFYHACNWLYTLDLKHKLLSKKDIFQHSTRAD